MTQNTQSRKFLGTVNSPKEKELTHSIIMEKLQALKGLKYACISDEIGAKESTYHTHVFAVYENPKLFSTMKKAIPEAHWDASKGTAKQNRDYVFKMGKWEKSEKETTKIAGTQEEFGTLPEEKYESCSKPELALLYELIKDGMSNAEILEQYPEYMLNQTAIDKCRLTISMNRYRDVERLLEVTYIYGATGTGKTWGVMHKYEFSNVFRVTDYAHPFDTYEGQDVLMFEEFASSLPIQQMLNYLDIYPLKLPARYSDKTACYTKVYITTNLPLEDQYQNVQDQHPEIWKAFLRRINCVMWYESRDKVHSFNSVDEYMKRNILIEIDYKQERIPFV